ATLTRLRGLLSLRDALPICTLAGHVGARDEEERAGRADADVIGDAALVFEHGVPDGGCDDAVRLRVDVRETPVGLVVRECGEGADRKSTRLNSSHVKISYAV